jgi:hypothetical protein
MTDDRAEIKEPRQADRKSEMTMAQAKPRVPRKPSQAHLLASSLIAERGTLALCHASERISFFHGLGDYDSVARWARVALAISKLQQPKKKRRPRGAIDILPPQPAPARETEIRLGSDDMVERSYPTLFDLSATVVETPDPLPPRLLGKYLRALRWWPKRVRSLSG